MFVTMPATNVSSGGYYVNDLQSDSSGHLNRLRKRVAELVKSMQLTITRPCEPGFSLGKGVNADGGHLFPTAIDDSHKKYEETNQIDSGMRLFSIITEENQSKEMSRMAEFSVSAPFSKALGTLNVMDRDVSSESEAHFFITHSYTSSGKDVLKDVKLTKKALDILNKERFAGFVNTYGSHYVAEHINGAFFLGKVSIKTASIKKSKEVAAEVQLKFDAQLVKANAGAALNSLDNMLSETHITDITLKTKGVNIPDAPTSVIKLKEAYESFLKQINSKNVDLGPCVVICEPWTNLSGISISGVREELESQMFEEVRNCLNIVDYDQAARLILSYPRLENFEKFIKALEAQKKEKQLQRLTKALIEYPDSRGKEFAQDKKVLKSYVEIYETSFSGPFRIGLNLLSHCKQIPCPDRGKSVWINKNVGNFNVNKECCSTSCNSCGKRIDDISAVAICGKSYSWEGQKVNEKEPCSGGKNSQDPTKKRIFRHLFEWRYLEVRIPAKS